MASTPVPRAFSSIAWVAVWNRATAVDSHDNDDASHGLLYFNAPHLNADSDTRARWIGLAQGVVDLSRNFVDGSKSREGTVHSARQRLVYIEPEVDYVLCLTLDLAQFPTTKHSAHGRSNSNGSAKDHRQFSDEGIEDEVLLKLLRDAYENFCLLNGSLEYIARRETAQALQNKLITHFDQWINLHDTSKYVLGNLNFPGLLDGCLQSPQRLPDYLETSIRESLQSMTECTAALFLDNALVIEPIHRSFLSSRATVQLLRYIQSTLPAPVKPKTSEDTSRRAKTKTKGKGKSKEGQSTTEKDSTLWPATLGVANLTNYIAMPSFSLGSSPPALGSGSPNKWSRMISWGSSPKSSSLKQSTSKSPTERSDGSDSDDSEMADHIAKLAEKTAQASEFEQETVSPVEGLQEAIDTELSLLHEAELEDIPFESFVVFDRFDDHPGDEDKWLYVLVAKMENVTLCLVHPRTLSDSSIERLKSEACAMLRLLRLKPQQNRRIKTKVSGRYVISTDDKVLLPNEWPTHDSQEAWSGSVHAAREADLLGALIAAHSNLAANPHTTEQILCCGTAQWAVAKKVGATTAYLTLPKRFGSEEGRDGHLVDAGLAIDGLLGRLIVK